MSYPRLVPGGSRTPQRLRRFVLVEEWMVAGWWLDAGIQPPSTPQPASRAGRVRRKKIRDDS